MNIIDDTLIRSLQNPALFGHPASSIEVIETHISWVLLTGEYVYKIKKPVNLGFLDFTTLAARKHYCEEEIRLNRRLAPHFYLEVVPIYGTAVAPHLQKHGEIIEYAVKMRQFPTDMQLDRIASAGQLLPRHIDSLADTVADFHARVAIANRDQHYGEPAHVLLPLLENFDHLDPCCTHLHDKDILAHMQYWSTTTHTRLIPLLLQRKATGFIREGHGDMHLANMFLWQDNVMLFDCIEFNPDLRWIDVISDIAFLTMDLRDREHPELARRFLNRYLQNTGDYAGLALLNYYQLYRALVRAKVACIRLHQPHLSDSQRQQAQRDTEQYLHLAEQFTRPGTPFLIITHGVSGSGKTYLTQSLLESFDTIRLRSDVERQRLFKDSTQNTSDTSTEKYSANTTEHIYDILAKTTRDVIQAGFSVIVDATFLQRSQRNIFAQLATQLDISFLILSIHASQATMRNRITKRIAAHQDASEADLEVLTKQLGTCEPLDKDELYHSISIDSEAPEIQKLVVNEVTNALSLRR